MSKSTNGPWHYVKHSWSDTGVYDENDLIAMLKISDEIDEDRQEYLEEEQEAHARLIAAAPELLEVLEEIKHYWICEEPQNARQYLSKKVTDLITKAKGESK